MNRDRSISPSPFAMQSKAKSQLTTGGHRHLTPSPIPTTTPPTSNTSTPSVAKGGGASGTPGNSTKKGQKRQTSKSQTPKTSSTLTAKQDSSVSSKGGNNRKQKGKKKSESSAKASIPVAPKIKTEPVQMAAAAVSTASVPPSSQSLMMSMPVLGMELTREISPIQSSNPTPEPILPPSHKKPRLASTGNSFSSSSDSSDSDSEGEEPMSHAVNAPPPQAPPHFSSVPVASVTTVASSQFQQSSMPIFPSHPVAQKGHIAQKLSLIHI